MKFDSANQLATFNGQTVTHDLDGNMVSGPLPTTGAMGNYTYDSRNRLTGAGAGMLPTASAVVANVIDIANNKFIKPFAFAAKDLGEGKFSSIENHVSEYYIRFSVKDEDGVLSSIASILSNNKVGFEKLHQVVQDNKTAHLMVITHKVEEAKIKASLAEVSKQKYIVESPLFIRVEE
jgi:homoserine dehydrogenase